MAGVGRSWKETCVQRLAYRTAKEGAALIDRQAIDQLDQHSPAHSPGPLLSTTMTDANYYQKRDNVSPSVPDSSAENREENGIRTVVWDADFCGCFRHCVPNCLMATCLPFISIAQLTHRLRLARFGVALVAFLLLYVLQVGSSVMAIVGGLQDPPAKGSTAVVAKITAIGASVVYLGALWRLRLVVRRRFRILGSACEDGCSVVCCSCCTLAQMATHTRSYEPGACRFGPPDMLPAFQ